MADRRLGREAAFVLGTIVVTLLVAWLSSTFALGWRSAFLLAVGMYAVLWGFAIATSDRFLPRLLLFGLAAGIVELAADCWLVRSTASLVYPNAEPMIACSPLYMPLAWAVVLTQVGYLGWLISRRERMWEAIVLTFVIGILFIPLFEHFAKGAGWWYYRDVPMLGNTPLYIILGEGLICMTLPAFFAFEAHRTIAKAVVLGAIQGAWIWIAYVVAYYVLG
jgi:hypothetical protein